MNYEFDCTKCGACCAYKETWPILKRDRSDAVSIPEPMVRKDLPLMRTVDKRCVALEGCVGCRVSCAIYENRPAACRNFAPGSQLCIEARTKLLTN